MSATAKDYAFIVNVKKGDKPIPKARKERIAAAKANVAKYLVRK